MPLFVNLLVSGLDYNSLERKRINDSSFLTSSLVEEVVKYNQSEDYIKSSDTYLVDFLSVSNVYDSILEKLKEEFEENNISSSVYKTSFDVISLLPESILLKLEKENIYSTNYGTIVLDWEDLLSNDEFSLEVGNDCLGYFSEFEGKDTVNVEEVKFSSEEVNLLHKKIEDFYKR
ncbi:hypothetical protein [Tenacibaculum dicentrarchi]|uniref:hypothetical protein n=1 Tax=Tenacibaculum dicentrarchi TaxID=669041 RepID=UPI003513108C